MSEKTAISFVAQEARKRAIRVLLPGSSFIKYVCGAAHVSHVLDYAGSKQIPNCIMQMNETIMPNTILRDDRTYSAQSLIARPIDSNTGRFLRDLP